MNLAYSISPPSKPNISFFHFLLKSHIEARKPKSALALFRHLLQSSLKPNDFTFSLLLKSSTLSLLGSNSLDANTEAIQIQNHLIKRGIDQFVYVSTALLDLYMKLGRVSYAHNAFDYMPIRDVVSWNALICGYSRNGYDFSALELFVQMLKLGFCPRQTTLVGLLPSCGQLELVFQGKSIHGFGIKSGLHLDPQVKNALTSMYAKCGDLEAAEYLFEEMMDKSVVSWNTMIGAYGQNGFFDEAMFVFKRMIGAGVEVSQVTIMSLPSANANPESIHCYTIKVGLADDASVVTSLICMYARYGSTDHAELLYWSLPQKNLVSLTAIITSYAEAGNLGLVMESFSQMHQLNMKPDSVAMLSILHGIADPVHISIGHVFHGYAIKSGLDTFNLVTNGLISMYSKFNNVEALFGLFSGMHEKPLISWNSVISGCVQAGRASHAIELFCQMKMHGCNPDAITIASLLSGCSQLGYLQFGERLHSYILRNKLEMEDFVGTALIHMYTKCGSIVHAERVFKSIGKPCLATWNAMISGYSCYGFEHKALTCYSEMQEQGVEPDKITFLGVLAACTHGGLIHEGRRYFQIMTKVYDMVPTLQHCACMVGLLARVGLFEEALLFIKNMEKEPDSAVWGAFLSACCIHQEVKLGEYLAKKLYLLDCRNGGLYVLMSNLYAVTGRWDDVARVREMMKDAGGDGNSGVSQIEDLEVIKELSDRYLEVQLTEKTEEARHE
ncbi:pentatricopeptide repeat-containing protein At2g04860 [Ricinus communis]|uniref:pentatricopeptide repeat-containing protein At2g04860 n=1 Tax=Ricinus communis TaxID=3988 RepID=UPI00201A2973|nr:pentatricopeptide repeat-containing protein At2g04860 [Ricinus communis]